MQPNSQDTITRGPIEANVVHSGYRHLKVGESTTDSASSALDDSADGGGQAGEAKTGEETRDGGGETGETRLDLNEEGGGTIGREQTEELGGVLTELLSLGGEVTNDRDGSDNLTDGAGDGGQVKALEERGDSLEDEGLASLADNGQGALDGRVDAVVTGSDALNVAEGRDDGANGGANLAEAKAGEETLNGVGELDESELAVLEGNGDGATGSTADLEASGGVGDLGDLANGVGDGAEADTAQDVLSIGVELDEEALALSGGDGQDLVDLAGDTGDTRVGDGGVDGGGQGDGSGGQESSGEGEVLHFEWIRE